MSGVSPQSLAAYPQVLTEKDWLAKRGAAQSVLDAEIAQGERLHARIDVTALTPSALHPQSLAALERAVGGCRDHLRDRVLPLQDQLKSIERAARRFGSARPAPEIARAAAEVARVAGDFARACGAVSWDQDYEAVRGAIAARTDKAGLMVDDAAARLMRAAKTYEDSAQRAADWQALIRPEGHRLSQIVSALPDYRARFWHKFKMFQSFDIEALKLEGIEEIDRTKRLAVLQQAVRQTEAIAEHRPD